MTEEFRFTTSSALAYITKQACAT